jgi:hypothetical protein
VSSIRSDRLQRQTVIARPCRPHFVGIEFASNWAIENLKDASRLVMSNSKRMESPGKSKE